MNDENQENEALEGPVIFTIPASLTVPGFGFLVALNRDWCFTSQKRRASRPRETYSRPVSTIHCTSGGGDRAKDGLETGDR